MRRPSMRLGAGSGAERIATRQQQIQRLRDTHSPASYDDSPAFVWRRGASAFAAAEGMHGARPAAWERSQTASPLERPSRRTGPPAVESAVSVQAAKLDRGILDRLADDVIRRVEQRIRIDRERRGL